MKKTLKIGTSDFKLIAANNHYFVDKTMLIQEFFNNINLILLMPRSITKKQLMSESGIKTPSFFKLV